MELFVEHVDVWEAAIPDVPGGLASLLSTLRDARANVLSIVAGNSGAHDGKGVVYVAPLETDREIAAASLVGFNVAQPLHAVRVLARDRPGLAAQLTQTVADAGVNLRGFMASCIGTQLVAYFALDTQQDAVKVVDILTGPAIAKAA